MKKYIILILAILFFISNNINAQETNSFNITNFQIFPQQQPFIMLPYQPMIPPSISITTNTQTITLPQQPIILPENPPTINTQSAPLPENPPAINTQSPPAPENPPSQLNEVEANFWYSPKAIFQSFYATEFSKGDINGDGKIDLLIGKNYGDFHINQSLLKNSGIGECYIFYNRKFEGIIPHSSADVIIRGSKERFYGSCFGYRVACGDINGDGKDDIITTDQQANINIPLSYQEGEVYIFYSKNFNDIITNTSADVTIQGVSNYNGHCYMRIYSSDINNDSIDDLIISLVYQGKVYIFYGRDNLSGIYSVNKADVIINGKDSPAHNPVYKYGFGVEIITSDINGDSVDDLIIEDSTVDELYVFYGGRTFNKTIYYSSADLIIQNLNGLSAYPFHSFYGGSDINGDGKKEIIIGIKYANGGGNQRGQVYIFQNNLSGTISASSADLIIQGEADLDRLGYCVFAGGDIDNNGKDDLYITGGGKTYMFYGLDFNGETISPSSADIIIPFGARLIDSFDINNDNREDLLIATGSKVYLFDGNSFPNIKPNFKLDIKPDTLNLKSQGKWMTAYIELPVDYNLNDIDINTVCISKIGDSDITPIYAKSHPTEIGDYDNDGIPDLMVKFDRQKVQEHISEDTESLTITVEGKLNDGTTFICSDNVRIIHADDQKDEQDKKELPKLGVFNNKINPNKNEHAIIRYYLDKPSHVKITVYNILGEKIKTIVDRHQGTGTFEEIWQGVNENGSVVTSGLYIVHIKTDQLDETRKMLVIK